MCTAQTARRRRRQAANAYRHIAPLRRPIYKKKSADKASRLLRAQIERLKAMQARKGNSKKK